MNDIAQAKARIEAEAKTHTESINVEPNGEKVKREQSKRRSGKRSVDSGKSRYKDKDHKDSREGKDKDDKCKEEENLEHRSLSVDDRGSGNPSSISYLSSSPCGIPSSSGSIYSHSEIKRAMNDPKLNYNLKRHMHEVNRMKKKHEKERGQLKSAHEVALTSYKSKMLSQLFFLLESKAKTILEDESEVC